MKRHLLIHFAAAFVLTTGCAIMHHTQLGEIDSEVVLEGRPFTIMVSETGVDAQEAGEIAKSLTQHQKTRDGIGDVAAVISLFQMGPRTGNPIYNDTYADQLFGLLMKECPSGRYSGLTLIRETNKYPVISGEIVRITGYCQDS